MRRCIVTRERQQRARMVRFVVAPDRRLVPDLAERLPGRGLWLSARRDVIETACARGTFAKAARGPVTVPPDLPFIVQAGLTRRIGELLGLARRGGQAVCGFAKVREWLEAGKAGLLVEARDGSTAERERLIGAHRVAVIAPIAGSEIGRIFGREHVAHAAVAPGRLAGLLTVEAERLASVGEGTGGTRAEWGEDREAVDQRTGA
jgi:predicted RNA-binding protein YlxR (DUF448 family)